MLRCNIGLFNKSHALVQPPPRNFSIQLHIFHDFLTHLLHVKFMSLRSFVESCIDVRKQVDRTNLLPLHIGLVETSKIDGFCANVRFSTQSLYPRCVAGRKLFSFNNVKIVTDNGIRALQLNQTIISLTKYNRCAYIMLTPVFNVWVWFAKQISTSLLLFYPMAIIMFVLLNHKAGYIYNTI